ncbi:MAG: PIN domain-containing protein [Thermomicrobiales bacterium]
MVTLDSSALLAMLDSSDEHHASVVAEIRHDRGPLIVPVAIMSEVAYFVERDLGQRALEALVRDIVEGSFLLDYVESAWTRILELVRRHSDMELGLADASVIECAERHGSRVLTLDRRHLGVVEREGLIEILP